MKFIIADDNTTQHTFRPSELATSLAVLKALEKHNNQPYLREAIAECESRMRPRLTVVSHFHYCQKCFAEIDDRVGNNFLHIVTSQMDYWQHRSCPYIKPKE